MFFFLVRVGLGGIVLFSRWGVVSPGLLLNSLCTETSLRFLIFLPQIPKCWDYSQARCLLVGAQSFTESLRACFLDFEYAFYNSHYPVALKIGSSWVGERAQWVKCLHCKPEDLHLET